MYKVIKNEKEFDGAKGFVYGVEHEESGQRFEDVSVWRSDAETLAKRMNDGELAPEQMQDVVEDYICELAEREVAA